MRITFENVWGITSENINSPIIYNDIAIGFISDVDENTIAGELYAEENPSFLAETEGDQIVSFELDL